MKLKNMYKHLHKAFPDNKIYERHMFRGAEGLGRIDSLLPSSPYVLSRCCSIIKFEYPLSFFFVIFNIAIKYSIFIFCFFTFFCGNIYLFLG